MKIALNAMQVRAAKSGVGQYIHALVEAMLRQDHTDKFIMYNSPQNVENYRFGARNFQNTEWALAEGNKILRLAREYLFLPREVGAQQADVFHGLSNFLPTRLPCPGVVTIHDLSYYVHPRRCPFLRRQYWYAMTKRTIATASAIITVSENSRRDLERFFPQHAHKVTVIAEAAHARFRAVEYGREKSAVAKHGITQPYLLYVGTLEPGKNLGRVIEGFDAIASDFPNHQLIAIGDRGWLYEDIFRAAKQARSRDRIHFLGHLPDSDVVDFMNFCDVFVYPSLYEGFGLPPLEAMACGAAVITSDSSSIPEVVGDAGILVDPDSSHEIARAMRKVLSDETLRADLQAKGAERAGLFSWDKAARETLRVYKRLVG